MFITAEWITDDCLFTILCPILDNEASRNWGWWPSSTPLRPIYVTSSNRTTTYKQKCVMDNICRSQELVSLWLHNVLWVVTYFLRSYNNIFYERKYCLLKIYWRLFYRHILTNVRVNIIESYLLTSGFPFERSRVCKNHTVIKY